MSMLMRMLIAVGELNRSIEALAEDCGDYGTRFEVLPVFAGEIRLTRQFDDPVQPLPVELPAPILTARF